jgi:hypothetical protein
MSDVSQQDDSEREPEQTEAEGQQWNDNGPPETEWNDNGAPEEQDAPQEAPGATESPEETPEDVSPEPEPESVQEPDEPARRPYQEGESQ